MLTITPLRCRILLGAATFVMVGCNSTSKPVLPIGNDSSGSRSQSPDVPNEHPHIAGAHGGIIVPIGADSYHAEAIVEKSGNLRLLILGKDESRIQEVDIQSIQAYVKGSGDTDATPIDLIATPQDGDAPGRTSQFVGQLPMGTVGGAVDVTIPNLRIEGARFRVGFTTSTQTTSTHDSSMPATISTENERSLYLTPGGKYTEADIQANGHTIASKKFKGIMSSHNMSPAPGDRICPVTLTKANPKFTWVINGQSYQFCCPPCVDEYVRIAKEAPEQLKDPDQFIK